MERKKRYGKKKERIYRYLCIVERKKERKKRKKERKKEFIDINVL